jgi:predicted nucleic acid-binding Zn ribbon protein
LIYVHETVVEKRAPYIARLGEILEQSLKRLELSGRLAEYGVWPIWNETVGPAIARNAQPEKIRNGTLFVKVASSVWMQQLQYMKGMIAEKLNQRLGGEVVKNIFFFVGVVEQPPASPETAKPARPLPIPHEAKVEEKDLESIRDTDLRRVLRQLLAASRRKAKK